MSVLDTKEYYARRKTAVEVRMMLRYYYEGIPYKRDPEDLANSPRDLRKAILKGNTVAIDDATTLRRAENELPDRADNIDYMDNLAADRIDANVAAVIPSDTALRIESESDKGVEKEVRKELFKRLLNFGDRFNTDKPEQDFFRWLKLLLTDCAQTGDGLILVQYLPKDDVSTGRIRYQFYPYESWDRQNDPITGDLKFYRIEFKFIDNDGKEYFYRRDYYPGRKVVYNNTEVPLNWNQGINPPAQTASAMDPLVGVVPPEMHVKKVNNPAEAAALSELGEACCVDVIWNEKNMDSYRGYPEVWFDDLPAVDSSNEILNALGEAVIIAGNPPLAAIDLQGPKGSDGKTRDLAREDMAAGAFMDMKSVDAGEHQGKMAFPDNSPSKFPHEDGLKQMRAAAMAGTPNMRLDEKGMMEISRMSGFAYMILTGQFDQKVKNIRQSAVARVLKALRLGIKLLRIKQELPDGLPDDFDIILDFGEQRMTEDERSKLAVTLLAYEKLGIPRDVLVKMIPGLSTDDIEKIKAGVLERADLDEELMAKEAQKATQVPAPKAEGNVDKKLQ